MKTHRTIEGALLQTGGTPGPITVSTVAEAQFYASGGFNDVLYAYPFTSDKLEDIGQILRQNKQVHVCVDHHAQLDAIIDRASSVSNEKWSVVIMVNCGQNREGVPVESKLALELAKKAKEAINLNLFGVYTTGGHSYGTSDIAKVHEIGEAERNAVVSLASRIEAELGFKVECIGVGSTPTSSNPPPTGLAGVTEMHPGNYVFYDWVQHK